MPCLLGSFLLAFDFEGFCVSPAVKLLCLKKGCGACFVGSVEWGPSQESNPVKQPPLPNHSVW